MSVLFQKLYEEKVPQVPLQKPAGSKKMNASEARRAAATRQSLIDTVARKISARTD